MPGPRERDATESLPALTAGGQGVFDRLVPPHTLQTTRPVRQANVRLVDVKRLHPQSRRRSESPRGVRT